ncbi:hypothetical protein [Nocardioides sp. MH1]|uniref:hypothetical protein n=1 Tax=Nocardioides sp. MH1 TaxID=3242490 RepID=UPI0035221614
MTDTTTTDDAHATADDLLAALAAGDRAAEFAVLHGTWDDLRDDPDATGLQPWLDAAGVGRLPREQRVEALTTRALDAATWPVAIGRPTLPRDTSLVAAWLRHQGVDASLAALLRRSLTAMAHTPAACDAGYDDLLVALLHAEYDGDDFPDEELAVLVMDYATVHERIEAARAGVDAADNTTLRPLLASLETWGPAVAPQLAHCLLDAADTATVDAVAEAAGEWTAAGVRAALRGRFAATRSATVRTAVDVAGSRHPAMADGARAFLAEDVKASSLERVRSSWDRRERDRLDAVLRSPRADRRRGLGFGARLKDAARRSVD